MPSHLALGPAIQRRGQGGSNGLPVGTVTLGNMGWVLREGGRAYRLSFRAPVQGSLLSSVPQHKVRSYPPAAISCHDWRWFMRERYVSTWCGSRSSSEFSCSRCLFYSLFLHYHTEATATDSWYDGPRTCWCEGGGCSQPFMPPFKEVTTWYCCPERFSASERCNGTPCMYTHTHTHLGGGRSFGTVHWMTMPHGAFKTHEYCNEWAPRLWDNFQLSKWRVTIRRVTRHACKRCVRCVFEIFFLKFVRDVVLNI